MLRLAVLAAAGSPLMTACGEGDDAARRPGPRTTIGLVSSSSARSTGVPEAIPEVLRALSGFAGDLYGRLASGQQNLVFSPYSAAVALAMTLPGANGRTATEIRQVLGVTDDARFHGGLNALTRHVEGLAGPQERADGSTARVALDAANQLFGQDGVGWEPDFLDALAREYGAGLRTVDYQQAHEQARTLINAWVADRTHDRIPQLVPAGALDALTRLVLVNALYLKAPWEVPFEKSLTALMPFHRPDGSKVEVETMVQPTLAGAVTRGDGWSAGRLPYAGGALAMTLVLPDPGRLGEVERSIAAGGLPALIAEGRPALLDLRLPRWTFRTQAPLKSVLQHLGMRAAFQPREADFRSMTTEDLDLSVSDVLHEGFVAVDEDGTEAAAATAVVIRTTSAPVAEPFHVDRPFVFVIHDVERGAPLFLGKVSDPRG